MATAVTLIRGDGIGPEVVDGAVRAVEATGAEITWEPADAGAGAVPTHGTPLPEATLESIRRNRLCLKGPLATPIGGGYRSVNVALRLEFDLYANVRPARTFAGLANRYENVDLVVVRENTQGEYSGIEHYIDPTKNAAESIAIITRFGSERIVRYAFELRARQQAPQEGHARPQGEHPEDDVGAVPAGRARDRAVVSRHRVQRPHRRQLRHAAGARPDAHATSSSRPTCSATSCPT